MTIFSNFNNWKRGILIPYPVLIVLILTAGYFYLTTAYWISFRPVCAPVNERNKGSLFERFLGYRFLEGWMRDEFRDSILYKLYWVQVVADKADHYVPINYYTDADIYWNFTTRAIRYYIGQELRVGTELNRTINPKFYDIDGNFKSDEFESLNDKFGYVDWFEFDTSRCDMVKFFSISNSKPPSNLEFAFEDVPLWEFDDTKPITTRNYPIKLNKNREIFQYFVKRFSE